MLVPYVEEMVDSKTMGVFVRIDPREDIVLKSEEPVMYCLTYVDMVFVDDDLLNSTEEKLLDAFCFHTEYVSFGLQLAKYLSNSSFAAFDF